jgi:hypothetical protein
MVGETSMAALVSLVVSHFATLWTTNGVYLARRPAPSPPLFLDRYTA